MSAHQGGSRRPRKPARRRSFKPEFDLLENVNLRDVVGEQMAQIEPAELLRMALADQARTLKLLRTVEPSSLQRRATQENGETMSAEEVARLPLINHLEMHVDQLERALG